MEAGELRQAPGRLKGDTRQPRGRASAAQPERIGNRNPLGPDVVKSAGRVLQILEFFDDIRKEANVIEVAEALDYPQSSTSVLLHSLVTCGYLSYDRRRRTYVTAPRVALLGQWANPALVREGRVLEFLKDINVRSGLTVILATRLGLYSQYIHVLQAREAGHPHVTLGTVRPLVASTTGFALLSPRSDAEVGVLVNRARAEAEDANAMPTVREVLAAVQRCRSDGYVFSSDLVSVGVAVISAPLPPATHSGLAIGVAGLSGKVGARRDEITHLLRTAVAEHFGPPRARLSTAV